MQNRFAVILVPLAILSISLWIVNESSAQTYLPDATLSAVDFVRGKGKRPLVALPKMETPLSEAYLGRDNLSVLSPDVRRQLGKYLVGNTVRVVVVLEEITDNPGLKAFLKNSRGRIVAEYKEKIEAIIPVGLLKALAERPEVLYVRRPLPLVELDLGKLQNVSQPWPLASTGNFQTEGVAAANADSWHTGGYTGNGVDIAILDYFQYWETAQLLGELPAEINTVGDLGLFSPHGTAVAEIVHDMAPEAALTFATPYSATQMASLIVDLAQAGNEIISSSLAYFNEEPGDGSGIVSSAVKTARETYGTLYCQAAGNHAQVHWDGYFSDLDADGFNDFASGSQEVNQLGYLQAGSLIILNLRWNDWPVADQDYDLHLVYWNGSSWSFSASSTNVQNGTQPPTESIFISAPTSAYYGFAVSRVNATGDEVLDIFGYGYPFYFNQQSRSLVDAATAADSFAVAAIDAATFNLESYSSHGPTHGQGGTLEGGLNQPRIAGFANVDTWAYGAGVFNGTSAATPHVSGAAALVFQAFPAYTPGEVALYLENTAVDEGVAGYDYLFGAGRLYLGDVPGSISVSLKGGGTGTIISTPPGILCGEDCSGNFPAGSKVVLEADAAVGSKVFWDDCQSQGGNVSGNNTSMATCTFLSLTGSKNLTAIFTTFPWHLFSPAITSQPGGR